MSRQIAKDSAKIRGWINACKREGAEGFSETFQCVLEKRLDSGARRVNPSREMGARIERHVRRSLKLPTRNPRTGRLLRGA